MPVDAINHQPQSVETQPKNINLSPDEFSRLLESLKNPRKNKVPEAHTTTNQEKTVEASQPDRQFEKKTQIDTPPVKMSSPTPPIDSIGFQAEATSTPVKAPIIEIQKSAQIDPKIDVLIAPGTNLQEEIIELGVIDKNNPTISQLLKNTPQFRKDTWNIVFSDINTSKEFNKIQNGSIVSINTVTNELSWKKAPPTPIVIEIPTDISKESITADGQIIVGEISKETPTVSHLLKQNSIYSDYTWKILFSDVNKSKPYTSLTSGKIVTIDPKTFELSFLNKNDVTTGEKISAAAARNLSSFATDYFNQDQDFSKRLANSVKSYIGTPYSEVDCYGLLVRGIKNQGINYNDSGGVRDRMEKLAIEQGLPLNAYQNGEGLIETSGTKLYDKSYISINDASEQSRQLLSEIQPILKEGEILSFSTPSQGHTGIISHKNNDWTYINSGVIDNQVDSGKSSKRVGEEHLGAELENWFALAKSKNESLKISIGILDEQKLSKGNQLFAQSGI